MSRDGVCVNCNGSPNEWRIVCPAVDPPQHLHRPHLLAVDPHQQLRGVPPPRYRQHRQSSGRHCNSKAHVLSHEQNGGAIEDIAVLAYQVTMPQAPAFSPFSSLPLGKRSQFKSASVEQISHTLNFRSFSSLVRR